MIRTLLLTTIGTCSSLMLSGCFQKSVSEDVKAACSKLTESEVVEKFKESSTIKRSNGNFTIKITGFEPDPLNPFWTADIRTRSGNKQEHLAGMYFCGRGVDYSVYPD